MNWIRTKTEDLELYPKHEGYYWTVYGKEDVVPKYFKDGKFYRLEGTKEYTVPIYWCPLVLPDETYDWVWFLGGGVKSLPAVKGYYFIQTQDGGRTRLAEYRGGDKFTITEWENTGMSLDNISKWTKPKVKTPENIGDWIYERNCP